MALSLAGCTTDDGPIHPPEISTAPQNPSSAADGKPAEDPPIETTPEAISTLQVLIADHYTAEYETEGDYRLLCGVEWNTMALGPESAAAYPALAEVLKAQTAEDAQVNAEIMAELLPWAQEYAVDHADYFNGFTSNSKYYIQRADDRILSVLADEDEYTGGVHPNYWVRGLNYDPATGEILSLADVLADTDGLADLLTEKLMAKYPSEPFPGLQAQLAEYTLEDYTWTLDDQGITFWFSPYEIAAFASGLLTTEIDFDEMPQMFAEAYMEVPEQGWTKMLRPHYDTVIDMNGKDTNLYWGFYADEYGSLQVYIVRDGQQLQLEEIYAYHVIPLLVYTGEGYYLYVEATSDNDYTNIYIYDLNGEGISFVSELSGAGFAGLWQEDEGPYGTWYQEVPGDPSGFRLDTTIQCLGTWTGYRNYHADPKTGSIIPETEDYTVEGDSRPITSAIDLEVTLLPEEKQETIPAGTEFRLCRTDGEGNAELALPDGRLCRIEIEWNEEVWERQINGIAEQECFTDLLYAG